MDKLFFDCNGNKILLGMFLQDISCSFLTYQVRLRNKKMVLHTGACYTELTRNRCKSLKIILQCDLNFLGDGSSLFCNSITD